MAKDYKNWTRSTKKRIETFLKHVTPEMIRHLEELIKAVEKRYLERPELLVHQQ